MAAVHQALAPAHDERRRAPSFILLALLLLVLGSSSAAAQTAGPGVEDAVSSISVSASTYVVPDSANYVQPTIAGDRDWLHLEARLNYEGLNTGSAWVGYNVSVGTRVTLDITPMIGAVFGDTTGIAPGYELSLGWRALTLYSETEYLIDTAASAESFLYTWSELELAPRDWYRVGLVVQRTKAYDTEFDIQRGLFAGLTYKRVSVTAYVFNPEADHPTAVVGVGVDF